MSKLPILPHCRMKIDASKTTDYVTSKTNYMTSEWVLF